MSALAILALNSGVAGAQNSNELDHADFSGRQLEVIYRAWTALDATGQIDASLSDVTVGYANGPDGLVTVSFFKGPTFVETVQGTQVGSDSQYFLVSVRGDDTQVLPAGSGLVH